MLDGGLLSRKSGFDASPVDAKFVVDNVGMRYTFLRVRQFPSIRLILPLLHLFIHMLTTNYSRQYCLTENKLEPIRFTGMI